MLFYNFNELNKFIKNNLIYDLTQEQKNIQKIIDLYKNKKTYFSEFITNMIFNNFFFKKIIRRNKRNRKFINQIK